MLHRQSRCVICPVHTQFLHMRSCNHKSKNVGWAPTCTNMRFGIKLFPLPELFRLLQLLSGEKPTESSTTRNRLAGIKYERIIRLFSTTLISRKSHLFTWAEHSKIIIKKTKQNNKLNEKCLHLLQGNKGDKKNRTLIPRAAYQETIQNDRIWEYQFIIMTSLPSSKTLMRGVTAFSSW